jgi:hypothetical protein
MKLNSQNIDEENFILLTLTKRKMNKFFMKMNRGTCDGATHSLAFYSMNEFHICNAQRKRKGQNGIKERKKSTCIYMYVCTRQTPSFMNMSVVKDGTCHRTFCV